jgi:hypothetical protein
LSLSICPLWTLRQHLDAAARALSAELASGQRLPGPETQTAARIAELAYDLGWRPSRQEPSLWELLAEAASDRPDEQAGYLDLAIAHSKSAAEVERLRQRLARTRVR